MFLSFVLTLAYLLAFFMPFSMVKCKTRSTGNSSPFGKPTEWPSDQLPTRGQVGAHYMWKRAEMEAKMRLIPSIHDVAKEVIHSDTKKTLFLKHHFFE